MLDLTWAFENPAVHDAGALPPVPLELDYGTRNDRPPQHLQRAAALGRPITPADCGPIRLISRYGLMVRSPGRVVLHRAAQRRTERHFGPDCAAFGLAEIGGDRWPVGDTGFVASWISGSEYVKIQTGIMLFFPRNMYLYQGPLPNAGIADGPDIDVMAGLEYSTKDRLWDGEDGPIAWSSINVIVRLPEPGRTVTVAAGDPLCWVFLVPGRSSLRFGKQPLTNDRREPTPGEVP